VLLLGEPKLIGLKEKRLNEMEFLVRAGLIFSEALCQVYSTGKKFLTDYNQSELDHVVRLKTDLIADDYFEKTWQERRTYYDAKIDEMVGKLADEQLIILEATEPDTCIM